MATKNDTAGRRTGLPIDLGAAALAAAALGFLMFAMPGGLFESLVVRAGLPDFFSAAQPPLGTTARGAAIAAAALAAFAAVLLLLRGLDRITSRARRKAGEAVDGDAPKLRRADAHPDAPARRPLLAGRELSEPVEDLEPEPAGEMFADLPAQPLPGFLVADEEEEPAEAAVEAESAQDEDEDALLLDRRADEGDFADDGEEASDEESIDERAFASLVSQLPEGPEEAGDDSITDLMRRLESGLSRREQADEGAEPDLPAEAGIAEAPDTPSWLAPQPQTAEAQAPAIPAQPPVDEFGELSWPPQREHRDVFASAPVPEAAPEEAPVEQVHAPEPEPEPQAGESRVGHRLRAAIDDMQKTAASGG